MRLLRTMMMLGVLPAVAAAEVEFGGSQGAFPVFGPSAEREAYFAAQEEARQAELEAQRLERERERERQAELERLEVQRQIAEAEARAREAEHDHDTILVNCVVVAPHGGSTSGRSMPFPRGHRQTRVTPNMPPLEPGPGHPGPYPRPPETTYKTVPCLPYQPVRPYGTELSISVDRGDVSGSLTVRRPGVGLRFGF